MKKCALFIFILLALLTGPNPAFSQEIFFNKVLPPEGKTFLHVTGMVQDRQGYMWFATKKGLFRYDGYEMTAFKHNPSDTNTLSTDALEAIAIDSSGFIWIATYGGAGLERFDPATGVFTHFRHNPKDPGSLSSDWTTTVFVDREGTLWVGTGHGRGTGLNRFNAITGKFRRYRHNPTDPTSISDNEVRIIYEDKQGILWIGTGSVWNGKEDEGGLNRMDKKAGKFTRYLHDPKNPHSLFHNKVRAVFEDSKGTFWVGTAGDGLHTMDRKTGTFHRYPYDPAHPEKLSRPPLHKVYKQYDHIAFITEDVTGALWIGTHESGLNYYNPRTDRTTHYEQQKDTAGAFTDRNTWSAYTSREGVLWISTVNGSLYRINPQRRDLPYYKSEEVVSQSFIEEKDGTLWTATKNGLLVQKRLGKNVIKRYVHEPGNPASLSNNEVITLKQDRQGNLWVGTQSGLNLLDRKKGTFTHYKHNPGDSNSLSSDFVITIYEDRKGDLWVGTLKGLNRMNRKTGTFTRIIFHPDDTSAFALNIVSAVLEDRQRQMWAGCWMIGDIHLLDRSSRSFQSYLNGNGIYSLCEDADGRLWAGGGEGLFQYNRARNEFEPYIDSVTHTSFSYLRAIVEDNQRNLWLSTERGILKLNPQRIVTRIYGKSYGVNGNQFCYGSGYKGNNGKLFFGSLSGYYAFLPDQLPKELTPPQIVVSDFRLASKLQQQGKKNPLSEPLSQVKRIRLQHDQNDFSLAFAVIDFSSPEDNRQFFMLENHDEDWNQAGPERKAVYYNVPPGRYVFRVKGANSNGIWAEKSLNIIITPPWWSTWWFRIPAAILAVALLYGAIRWRMQQKFRLQLERSEKEKQLADLRHKTAELEMQALRAQMNPHFIFNSLNSINRFILQNNKLQASEYLTKFSRLVRLILQNSQADLVPLESELEALQLYLELEALRFEQHFEFKINVDKNVDDAALKVPPLIIQPFAENAIWHGLMHKVEKGHLDIKLFQEEEALCCRITDDGIGRRKAAELKSKSATTHQSMGMRITTDRIALLQQQKMIPTSVQVTDLVLPDGQTNGTEVLLKLPAIYD